MIGTVLIYFDEEVDCWKIGYNLGKKYWSKGYTTEAMKKVMEFENMEVIDKIRRKYDLLTDLVRSHITLVFPFEDSMSNEVFTWIPEYKSQNK